MLRCTPQSQTLHSISQHGFTLHSLFYTSESESELSSTDRCQTPCFTVGAQIITPFIGASMSEFYNRNTVASTQVRHIMD